MYPLLKRPKPLKRMCAGMFLATVAFVFAGFLQMKIQVIINFFYEKNLFQGINNFHFIVIEKCVLVFGLKCLEVFFFLVVVKVTATLMGEGVI